MPDYSKQKGGKPAKDQLTQRDRNVPLVPKTGRADKSELLARMKAAAAKAAKEG